MDPVGVALSYLSLLLHVSFTVASFSRFVDTNLHLDIEVCLLFRNGPLIITAYSKRPALVYFLGAQALYELHRRISSTLTDVSISISVCKTGGVSEIGRGSPKSKV